MCVVCACVVCVCVVCVCVFVCVCCVCVCFCVVQGVGETDRRSPLAVVVTLSPVKRITSNESVDGLQDIFDLRDYPLLEVLPQNNLEQTVPLNFLSLIIDCHYTNC